MKKSSWFILGVCAALMVMLGYIYVKSHQPVPEMTQATMSSMLDKMKDAVAAKNAGALMTYIDESPDTRVSNLNNAQLRLLLSRAFRQSENLDATYSGLVVHSDGEEERADFDLKIVHQLSAGTGEDYHGHIVLHLKLVEVPHLLGMYHTKEWRIVHADTDGPDLANYGDY